MCGMIGQTMNSEIQTFPVIALLTDFGNQDTYVGAMKGVIWSICPAARLIDITHTIQPQNVRQAAYALLGVYRYMPPQTIVVAIIDPGVGSSRKPIAVETHNGIFVGPDNGLFSYVLKQTEIRQIVALQNPQYMLSEISATFHGRDIFSPMAAHLAKGVPLEQLGPNLNKIEWLDEPYLQIQAHEIEGEVVSIDHFGNISTSIGRLLWGQDDLLYLDPLFGDKQATKNMSGMRPEGCVIKVGSHEIETMGLTYATVNRGEVLALINSAGYLEIAVNQGNAGEQLQIGVGDKVKLLIR